MLRRAEVSSQTVPASLSLLGTDQLSFSSESAQQARYGSRLRATLPPQYYADSIGRIRSGRLYDKAYRGARQRRISERYVHPTPEHVERTLERFETYGFPTKVNTVKNGENGEIAASAVQ